MCVWDTAVIITMGDIAIIMYMYNDIIIGDN